MACVARPSITLAHAERLHQVPTGEVRAGDVADLAFAYELVQRVQCLFHGRQRVECMKVVDVDVVGAEALQRAF